jgi:hypothetical protein
MSDGHEHDHDDAADAHHDHDFDGEPVKELAPDEPRTPGWVPLVGAAVFVLGAVFLLTRGDAEPPGGSGEKGDAHAGHDHPPLPPAAAAPQQQPRPVQPIQAPARPVQPGQPMPAGSDQPNVKKLTPEQIKDLQKRVLEAKQKREAGEAK